jgi:hypothetical protein
MTDDLDFTPRPSRARVPIFCQQCRKQGRVAYRQDDNPRYGGGRYSGPTMALTAYLAGAPKVCQSCDMATLTALDLFSEQE